MQKEKVRIEMTPPTLRWEVELQGQRYFRSQFGNNSLDADTFWFFVDKPDQVPVQTKRFCENLFRWVFAQELEEWEGELDVC